MVHTVAVARRLGRGARLLGAATRRRDRRARARRAGLRSRIPRGCAIGSPCRGRRRAARRRASGDSGRAGAAGLRRRARICAAPEREPRAPRGDARVRSAQATTAWEARGASRGGLYAYDEPPAERGLGGAGTVHHVAWSSTHGGSRGWHERVTAAGCTRRRSSTASGSARSTSASRAASSSRSRRSARASPRRGPRAPRRDAHPPARVRAPARAGRADADADSRSAPWAKSSEAPCRPGRRPIGARSRHRP